MLSLTQAIELCIMLLSLMGGLAIHKGVCSMLDEDEMPKFLPQLECSVLILYLVALVSGFAFVLTLIN